MSTPRSMLRISRLTALALLLAALLSLPTGLAGFRLANLPGVAFAQSGGGYDLSWNTVDGGGATFSTVGAYALGGTVAQADAGLSTGGTYILAGGFWRGGMARYRLYLPLVMRSFP